MKTMKQQIDDLGYSLFVNLTEPELKEIKDAITALYLKKIEEVAPEHLKKFKQKGIEKYHKLAHLVDHSNLWIKKSRMLNDAAIKKLMHTSMFNKLRAEFGDFTLTDVCPQYGKLASYEVYWRLVRPNEPNDIGPVHADRWFWDVGTATIPEDKERIKVWIAICCEPGKAGLRVFPRSHKKEFKYHTEEKHGTTKPMLDADLSGLDFDLMNTDQGQAVVFHDSLLHGGVMGTGKETRVSVEFTRLVDKWRDFD